MWSFGPWELVILLSKVLSYTSLASLSGGIFILWLMVHVTPLHSRLAPSSGCLWALDARQRIVAVLLAASLTGALSVTLFFLLQIGLINQAGIAGMFDPMMIGLVAGTSVGYGVALRLLGFLIAGLAVLMFRRNILHPEGFTHVPGGLLAGGLAAAGCFAVSFAILGHVAGLGLLAHVAIAFHIAAIGLWLGSFYPLHTLCRPGAAAQGAALQRLLHVFGQFGWGITGVLIVAGVYLLTQVFMDSATFFGSIYGRLLTVKIALVCCLLALAALNKFRLTGELPGAGTSRLRRSIAGEMLLAFIVLLLTAAMTTFTGPAHLM